MADRPILFNAPMVRALLAGTKTQTRRAIKDATEGFHMDRVGPTGFQWTAPAGAPRRPFTPRYQVGDRLWVREAWHSVIGYDDRPPRDIPDGTPIFFCAGPHSETGWVWGRVRPSMFMPRWASRLTLTVTDVRLQRLQEISEADAMAEGIDTDVWDMAPVARRYGTEGWFVGWSMGVGEPSVSVQAEEVCRRSYASLWDQINGTGSWAANPWVVAYSFTVDHRNIDEAIHG